jgi:hypothetical protein
VQAPTSQTLGRLITGQARLRHFYESATYPANLCPFSVQTTERYLGCKQRLQNAVNDRIGIEPNS